ncbi:GTP1/OBG family protein [Hibiscus syriacus]|uniref:non-specific serine/threonine protein kinase n=1 Tax=Hibiscus syriacus TaxID=106335 RepID=A0A6A2WC01_HIBSY|nr:GTP1/OBG family protein [Hibiscus syriacus]
MPSVKFHLQFLILQNRSILSKIPQTATTRSTGVQIGYSSISVHQLPYKKFGGRLLGSFFIEWNKGAGPQGARQFRLEELEQATKQFADSNLIGFGSFGPVYKGRIHDNVVAIKIHQGGPREEYNAGRLSIALVAARGLCHLHSLIPPLIHKNFKKANVLVDENFTDEVADAGIAMLLEKIEEAGPSHSSSINVFRDSEVEALGSFTEMSDVYSFRVFLLELITGRDEAVHID